MITTGTDFLYPVMNSTRSQGLVKGGRGRGRLRPGSLLQDLKIRRVCNNMNSQHTSTEVLEGAVGNDLVIGGGVPQYP